MKVVVGSKNPVKILATKVAFGHYFKNVDVTGEEVSSGVPDQPIGDETFKGAYNRAIHLSRIHQDADFMLG